MIIDDGEFSIWNCVVLKLKAQFASHKLRRPKKKKNWPSFLFFTYLIILNTSFLVLYVSKKK